MTGVLLALVPPTVVLVTGAAPGPEPARIEAARDQLRTRFRVIDGPREVLEGYAAPASPEEATRDALERAHQRLRRFDLAGVRQALAEARDAATHLLPTLEGRRLAAVVALREAELALVAKDRPGQKQAAAFALAIDPALTPDPQRVSPQVIELVEQTKKARARAAPIRVRVETTPPGGRILVGDRNFGAAPVEIETAPGPLVVWATRDGSQPRALWTLAKAGDTLSIELEPQGDAERLRPLVATLRQAALDRRRAAALALADALGADALALLESAGEPTIYQRQITLAEAPPPEPAVLAKPAPPPAPPPAQTPVYRRAWFWAVIGGVAVASAGAAAVYYFSQPESASYTCCR